MQDNSTIEKQLNPLIDSLSNLTYQVVQQGKSYFGLTHKTLTSRLTKLFVPGREQQIKPVPVEVLARFQQSLQQIIATDWQDAQQGVYPPSLLFDNDWQDFLLHYPALWLDLPFIWQRLNNKQYQEFAPEIDRKGYPQYYLQNFHYQTDGYLSEQSANLYDIQVDILFNGAADAMRRRILAPLHTGLHNFIDLHPKQARILDVACGTGRTLKLIRTALPQASLCGVDLSPTYLRKANQILSALAGELPQLIQANAEELPYQDEYFHGVVSVFLFHELPKVARQQVIEEMYRVTKPGGVCILCDSMQSLDSPELQPMMDNFPLMYHEPYYRDYINDDLTQRLRETGFEQVRIEKHFVSKYWIAHKSV